MYRTLLARLAALPVVLFATSVLVFLLPQLTGVSTARAVLHARSPGSAPDAATLRRLANEFGLNRPLPKRYVDWLGHALTGDFGLSYTTRTPVAPQVLRATGVSVTLVALALALAVAVGVPAGVRAAARRGGLLDRAVAGASVLGVAVPEFIVGPLLVLVFAVVLTLLPATGWGTVPEAVLPILSLATFPATLNAQLTRAEMLDAMGRPFVAAARARGLPERRVLWRHAGRTALTSVTALSSVLFAGLLGGDVIVEVIFAVPGLGRLLYDAVLDENLPVIQAGLLTVIALAMLASIAAELLQLAGDPLARRGASR